tara:strand:+ start:230 stop:1633 length:1404 start_codon:yes stop_codon:yes gene_type:complete
MTKVKITPVILSGGFGKRLWPISRKSFPKQFLKIPFGSKLTLFQKTILRTKNELFNKPIVICSAEHKFIIREQISSLSIQVSDIIVEPVGRNTAPAICISALKNSERNNDLLMIFPSDHLISDEKSFIIQIRKYLKNSSQHNTLFGLKPLEPNTDFGYIKTNVNKMNEVKLEKFIEKPNLANAKSMLSKKNYFWNSGIFLLKTDFLLNEFKTKNYDIYKNCNLALKNSKIDLGFLLLEKNYFKRCKNVSFDYEILEKTKDFNVLTLNISWNDLGSWKSIWNIQRKDKNGNVKIGKIKTSHAKNSLIISDQDCNIVNDISNLIIICKDNSLLVTSKINSNEVKNQLDKTRSREYFYGFTEYRPWGSFKIIEKNSKFIVKKLNILPKHKISLQKHLYRSEHWTVVNGIANITLDKKSIVLKKSQSIYIPKKAIHRIENKTEKKLEIIETQIGEKLSEEDIIRYEDPYNR